MIDDIYIIKLKFVEETNIQRILDAIKAMNKDSSNSTQPAIPELPKIENLIPDNNFDKNF